MARTFSTQDVFVAARELGVKTAEASMIAMMTVHGHGFEMNQRAPEKLRHAITNRNLQWSELMPPMSGIKPNEAQGRLWFKAALGHHPFAEIEAEAGYDGN